MQEDDSKGGKPLEETAEQASQRTDEQNMSKEDLQSDSFRMFSFKVCFHFISGFANMYRCLCAVGKAVEKQVQ